MILNMVNGTGKEVPFGYVYNNEASHGCKGECIVWRAKDWKVLDHIYEEESGRSNTILISGHAYLDNKKGTAFYFPNYFVDYYPNTSEGRSAAVADVVYAYCSAQAHRPLTRSEREDLGITASVKVVNDNKGLRIDIDTPALKKLYVSFYGFYSFIPFEDEKEEPEE